MPEGPEAFVSIGRHGPELAGEESKKWGVSDC